MSVIIATKKMSNDTYFIGLPHKTNISLQSPLQANDTLWFKFVFFFLAILYDYFDLKGFIIANHMIVSNGGCGDCLPIVQHDHIFHISEFMI